eukprot:CAMPEP_0170541122 /NCGR_PEP_ID=MMETSP0211-20121228/945_1 /TAXON_ID=311385 /ORGANISM="Pseudokeronopsis sp., Strain OXSARD2" /LENGTH=39 /DNA_ID= /DNA_START= /DNA_END= /DNA_ORIENTATION=
MDEFIKSLECLYEEDQDPKRRFSHRISNMLKNSDMVNFK